MKSSDYLPGYKTVHMAFAMLRVLQLWHGASSDIFKKAARSVASGIEKRGLQEVFDDAHTAIMFTTLMCDVNGVLPFECPSKRSFLTTQDRILRNPSLLFACMVDGPAGIHTLKHGSAKLRSSARYMEVMMRFYGKDVLLAFDASLLGLKPLGADGARALQHQRQMAAVA